MILKKEIEIKAEEQNIPKSTIDKDWVLGHFIDAIFSIPECKENLIFKGGTCLRKCYFSNYRFSEDLDFTCTNPKFELTKKILDQLVQIITERTEIPLHIEQLIPLKHKEKLTGYKESNFGELTIQETRLHHHPKDGPQASKLKSFSMS